MKLNRMNSPRSGLTRLEALLVVVIIVSSGACFWLFMKPSGQQMENGGFNGAAGSGTPGSSFFSWLTRPWRKAEPQATTNGVAASASQNQGHETNAVAAAGQKGQSNTVTASSYVLRDETGKELQPIIYPWETNSISSTRTVTGMPKRSSKTKAPEFLVDAFRAALESGDPYAMFGRQNLTKLNIEEVQQCLDMLASMEWGPQANMLLQGLMVQWAVKDPLTAIEYATSIGSRRARSTVMTSIMEVWSKQDPQSALSWLLNNARNDPVSVGTSIASVFRNLAARDAASALVQVWTLPDLSMRRTAIKSVVNTMAMTQREDVLAGLYDTMVPGPDRTMLAEAIVDNWSRYEPEKAGQWILEKTMTPEDRSRTIDRLVTYWGYDRPQQAAEWVAQLPVSDLRRAELGKVTQMWAQDDLMAAASWVSQFPQSTQTDPAVQSIAMAYAKQDAATGISWAESISDIKLRSRTVQAIAAQWLRQNPAAAQDYIAQSTLLSPIIKKSLIRGSR